MCQACSRLTSEKENGYVLPGLQRFCTEHKIKLSKIDHIFLSCVYSETTGGIPGLLLTLAGMGDEGMSVNVWGPSDLKYLVDAMKSFIPHAAMVHAHSFDFSHKNDESVELQELISKPVVALVEQTLGFALFLEFVFRSSGS